MAEKGGQELDMIERREEKISAVVTPHPIENFRGQNAVSNVALVERACRENAARAALPLENENFFVS